MSKKRIVITGGPGTGKSSLIRHLTKKGYPCLEEISRQITLNAQEQGIDQLFLTDPLLFSDMLLKDRQKQYTDADAYRNQPVFFDRGCPDVLAYMEYIGNEYPETFVETCKRSPYDLVFILKPWQDIYIKDNERYENFDQVLKIHKHLVNTYQKFNYKLINVPFDTVENRTDFVLKTMKL